MRGASLPALTGLRAIASVWVLAFHLLSPARTAFPSLAGRGALIDAGYLGVDVFFVLSGFVLAHAYGDSFTSVKSSQWLRFWWLRLARVWPLHAAVTLSLVAAKVLAGGLGFATFASSPLFRFETLPAHLALVQAWGGTAPTWNVPSWSVSCEWLAYLAFPILSLGSRRVRRPSALLAIAGLVATLFVVYAYIVHGGALDLTYQGGVARIAAEFTIGVLLERATRGGFVVSDGVVALLASVIGAAAMLDRVGPWLVAPIALLVIGVARNEGRIAKTLARGPLVYWGERSYAVYLVHGPILLVARGLMPIERVAARSPVLGVLWLVGVLVASFVVAHAAHRFVEEPARRLLRRLGPRDATATAGSVAASA